MEPIVWDHDRVRRIARTPLHLVTDDDCAYMDSFMLVHNDDEAEVIICEGDE